MVGISVAAAFFFVEKLIGGLPYPVFRLMVILWPSSFFLMATDGSENTLGSYAIVLLAILVNGLAYLIGGVVLWAGFRILRLWIGRE